MLTKGLADKMSWIPLHAKGFLTYVIQASKFTCGYFRIVPVTSVKKLREKNRVCDFAVTYKEAPTRYFHEISRHSTLQLTIEYFKQDVWLMDKKESETSTNKVRLN